MNKSRLLGAVSTCIFSLGLVSTSDAALLTRLSGLAYYDDVADLTWLADANAGGELSWENANAWAASLVVGGEGGWRLPETVIPDAGCTGTTYPNTGLYCTASEMGNLYYNVLGNVGNDNASVNLGPFNNLDGEFGHWSATNSTTDALVDNAYVDSAYLFQIGQGFGTQAIYDKAFWFATWAVKSGDVPLEAVPVPAAVWLFGSGLLGLVGMARRKDF